MPRITREGLPLVDRDNLDRVVALTVGEIGGGTAEFIGGGHYSGPVRLQFVMGGIYLFRVVPEAGRIIEYIDMVTFGDPLQSTWRMCLAEDVGTTDVLFRRVGPSRVMTPRNFPDFGIAWVRFDITPTIAPEEDIFWWAMVRDGDPSETWAIVGNQFNSDLLTISTRLLRTPYVSNADSYTTGPIPEAISAVWLLEDSYVDPNILVNYSEIDPPAEPILP